MPAQSENIQHHWTETKGKANQGVIRFKLSAEGFDLSQALKDCAEIVVCVCMCVCQEKLAFVMSFERVTWDRKEEGLEM